MKFSNVAAAVQGIFNIKSAPFMPNTNTNCSLGERVFFFKFSGGTCVGVDVYKVFFGV